METDALQASMQLTLWAAFVVAMVFGCVARYSHFCTMGAISDAVHMGDWTRLRMWGLAVAVATIGFHVLASAGLIDASQTMYASGRVRWLSALVGGLLFGLGMVLASGCGAKNLVRIGGGSLKSLVVFCVTGLAAFATMRGITAVSRVQTLDRIAFEWPAGAYLGSWVATWTGHSPADTGLVLSLLTGGLLAWWVCRDADFRRRVNVLGGLVAGLCVVAMWWVSGVLGFVPEHPETLAPAYLATASGRMESLSFTAPMAQTLDWLLFFSDSAKTLSLGVVAVAGVVAGALVHALISRDFHWEGFHGTQDTALHLMGAVCMGVGGVTAMGCTIGQGLSGLSTLSIGSAIAVLGIVLGAIVGLRVQQWLIDRE